VAKKNRDTATPEGEERRMAWDVAMDRIETDDEFFEAMKLAGPAVVEVQSPSKPVRDQLEAHPGFAKLCEQLRPKLRGGDPAWLLLWFVPVALDPPLEELMTRSERTAIAQRVTRHAAGLRECLQELMQANGSYCFPFQPVLSQHAVLTAANDYLRWKHNAEETDVAAIVYRTRFAIYRAVSDDLADLLWALEDAAQLFADSNSKVHRPKNENARRLYFLRYMTNILNRETGRPCRNIVLELASMYFDCGDLDEAALSKLAPVKPESKTQKSPNDSG